MSEDRSINADLNIRPGEDSAQAIAMLGEVDEGLKNIRRTTQQSTDELDIFRQSLIETGDANAALNLGGSPGGGNVPGGGGADSNKLGKTSKAATQGVRTLTRSVNALGIEMSDGANAIAGVATVVPPLITGLNGMAVSAVATEIAMTPLIVIGALVAAAMVGLVFIIDGLKSSSNEAAEKMQAQVAAQEAYNDALNLTSNEIENQIAANEEARETNRRNLEVVNDLIIELDGAGDGFLGIGDALGIMGAEGDQLNERFKELTAEAKELAAETEALAEAYNSVEVAANDAREALLEEVDQLADIREFEQQALASSAEENAKRAQAIADESAIIREQIAVLEDSGDTSKEVQDKIAGLNSELGQLGQQSDVLSSSAVKAAESQKALAAAESELESAANEAAAKLAAAVSKTAAARANERKAIAAAGKASREAAAERIKFQKEQDKELTELQQDNNDARIQAEKDFNKSIEDLVANQSFLAAIDRQDDFVDSGQTRRDAARKDLINLQMDLAEERIVKEIAAQEEKADRAARVSEAVAERRNARREEIKLRRVADQEALKLRRNRAEQELELQGEINKNLIAMLQSVVGFSGDAAIQVQKLLSQAGAANSKGGKKGKSDLTSLLGKVMN